MGFYTSTATTPLTRVQPLSALPPRQVGPRVWQQTQSADPTELATHTTEFASAVTQPAEHPLNHWLGAVLGSIAAVSAFFAGRRFAGSPRDPLNIQGIPANHQFAYALMAASGNTINMTPLNGRVVVEKYDTETKTSGGLLQLDAPDEKTARGTVVALGDGDDTGLVVGDNVLFGRSAGLDIKVEDKPYTVLLNSEVMAKIE